MLNIKSNKYGGSINLLLLLVIGYLYFNCYSFISVAIGYRFDTFFSWLAQLAFIAPLLFLNKKLRKWYLGVTLVFSTAFFLFSLFHYFILGNLPQGNTYLVMLSTNLSESTEFVNSYWRWKWLGLGLLWVLPKLVLFYILQKIPKAQLDQSFGIYLKLGLFIILIYFSIHQKSFLRGPFGSNIVYADNAYKQHGFLSTIKDRHVPLNVKKEFLKGRAETHVLILGESLTRNHMSLYGYDIKTNPRLEARRNELVIFSDVLASHCYTVGSVYKMLSNASWNKKNNWFGGESIIELCKQSGYKTYWITNQPIYKEMDTPILAFAELTDSIVVTAFEKEKSALPDMAVLPHFQNVLDKDSENKLIIIHLMGSHLSYKSRSTESYRSFNAESYTTLRPDLDEEQKTVLSEYDNSVLYNDHLIDSMITIVESRSEFGTLLYLSDHGDNVFDERDDYGHNELNPTKSMFEVPFMLWSSQSYENYKPEFYDSLGNYTDRPFQTDDLLHGLIDLYGIQWDNHKREKSVFSNEFVAEPRWHLLNDSLYQIDTAKFLLRQPIN